MKYFCHFISLLRKDSGRLQGSPLRLMYTYIKPFANSRTNYNPFNGHSCLIYWVCKDLFAAMFTNKRVMLRLIIQGSLISSNIDWLGILCSHQVLPVLLTYPDLSNLICVLISYTKTDNSSLFYYNYTSCKRGKCNSCAFAAIFLEGIIYWVHILCQISDDALSLYIGLILYPLKLHHQLYDDAITPYTEKD